MRGYADESAEQLYERAQRLVGTGRPLDADPLMVVRLIEAWRRTREWDEAQYPEGHHPHIDRDDGYVERDSRIVPVGEAEGGETKSAVVRDGKVIGWQG